MAVQRIVGRIQIEDDLLRRPAMGLQKDIYEQPLNRRRIVADLVVARGHRPAQLQPIKGALARNRRALRPAGLKLARQDRHHRVVAELVMIGQILVAERDPKHSLTYKCLSLVLDQLRTARILK
jgi:hypothetical protein